MPRYFDRFSLVAMVAVILLVPSPGCRALDEPEDAWPEAAKVRFPIDDIRPDGLRGPPDGLRSVAFEFCAPADTLVYQELLQIDAGLEIQPATPGRIGCQDTQALVIGETGHPGWRYTLEALTRLDYVKEISECFFE